MKIAKDELIPVLSQFNPWWRNETIPDLPTWRRGAFNELYTWTTNPPAPRSALVSGARQIGKTTLILQIIDALLKEGVHPANIFYATFDHPLIKLAGIEKVLAAWRERTPKTGDIEYVFLDEAQFIKDCGTWIKHQVDFVKDRRIVFTGSAMPLLEKGQESGVGRWHTIGLTTLSFYEYLQLKKDAASLWLSNFITNEDSPKVFAGNIDPTTVTKHFRESLKFIRFHLHSKLDQQSALPNLPQINSLEDLFNWPQEKFYEVAELAKPYIGHFHEYLIRGGFPQTAQIESINQSQRLLREDVIDKVLKRDMTAVFGVRLISELEQMFLYLCMHDNGRLDMEALCSNLGINRPTAQRFLELLEQTHLIYRLQPFGYGKEILRGRYKIYLADPAIAPAVLLKGKSILDDTKKLGGIVEAAVHKHVRSYYRSSRLSYWQNSKHHEVDIIVEFGDQLIPFEIKYESSSTNPKDLRGLLDLCQKKSINRAYLITKSVDNFGLLKYLPADCNVQIMQIPAALLCYWMGEYESQK